MTILHFITLSTVWHYSTVITFLHLYTAHSSSSSQSSLDTKLLFPELRNALHRCNFNGRFVAFFVSINATLVYDIRCYNTTFCRHKDRVTDANKLQSIQQPLGLQSCCKGLDNKMQYKPTTPLWLPLAMAGCSHVHREGVIQGIHAWCRTL